MSADDEVEVDVFGNPYGGGMAKEPDLDDEAQYWVDRVIKALQEHVPNDTARPRFIVVVETPPAGEVFLTSIPALTPDGGGRIAVASDADDEIDTHRLLTLAAAGVRHQMSGDTLARAREYWDKNKADVIEMVRNVAPPPPPRKRGRRRR